jgi:hypothetical protein
VALFVFSGYIACMDDAFIGTAGQRIPVTISEAEQHSARNVALAPRRSSRRRAAASRSKQHFEMPELHGSVENTIFETVPYKPDSAVEHPTFLSDHHIGAACDFALELLDRRILSGDTELSTVKCVVQRCLSLISAMPPLSLVDRVPLRPDDRLYECFDQFLSLLRRQESQMLELQTMINELI